MKPRTIHLTAMLALAALANAAPQTPSYTELTLPSMVSNGYFRGAMIFADMNADGYMDMLVKGRDLNNGWSPDVLAVTTDATGAFVDKMALPASSPYESTITALDFNNDGLVDYMITAYGHELYKNNGDGTFAKMDNFSLESNISIGDDNGNAELWYSGIAVAADFNLDGWQDIIVMGSDGNPTLYTNNGGDGSFTLATHANLFAQRSGTMCVGDYNGDGYPDLLVSGWSDEVGNDCISINKNNGDGTFTRVSSDAFVGTEKGQVMFVDIDGDGLLDVFVTGQSCPEGWANVAYLYRNNGDDTFSKVQTSLTGVCKGACDWADLNGDGHIDIVYGGESSNNSRAVVVINEGSLVLTPYEDLLCRARGGAAVATYDVNRNGFPDIAIMGYNDDGAPHMHVFNGLCSRNINEAPSAPTNLAMAVGDGKVTFTWDAATDNKTPQAALRYNIYVKLTDGSLVTLVPADPQTGALRLGDVNAAILSRSYTLNIDANRIAEWGVQAIDGGKCAGAFAVGEASTAISSVAGCGESVAIEAHGGQLTVSHDATVTVTSLGGATMVSAKVSAGEPLSTQLPAGIYIVRAAISNANEVKKVYLKGNN